MPVEFFTIAAEADGGYISKEPAVSLSLAFLFQFQRAQDAVEVHEAFNVFHFRQLIFQRFLRDVNDVGCGLPLP